MRPPRVSGTVTLLRVDDAWRGLGNERSIYDIGDGYDKRGPRYVPLRYKADVGGLDGSDRIVTKDDFVTISLSSGFIKYFKELGGSKRRGEIALVVSFDAGGGAVENVLIYSAKGQTLGSYFPLDDWPVLGPLKVTGDHLRMRVIMIELDQAENEQARNLVKFLSQTAGTVAPGIAGLFSIAKPVVDQLIGFNTDDVVVDYRFSLRRTGVGMPVTENPLLFGTYVLMLQQDRLSDPNVKKIAPLSITPIVPSDMRFDRYSNRLQKVYNYQDHWAADPGKGPIGWKSISTSENGGAATTTDLSKVNSAGATDIRGKELGYTTPTLGEYEVFPTDVKALKVALLEACRSAPVTKADDGQFSGCANYQLSEGEYGFEYPVTQYPEAFTLLAQYPLHTHLVFSVERTVGGTETPYHEGFRTFSEYVQEQISEARSNTDLSDFSELFGKAVIDFRKQNGVLARLGTFPDKEKMERVCLLWEEGLHGTEPERTSLVSKAPVYNELFHVTERIMTEPDEVARFIASSGCTKGGSDEQKCSCEDAVAKRIAAADAPVPAIGSRKLVLTVPLLTGGDVSAVQKALGDKGFPVTGEDGTYGSATETQVKAFQMVQGLTVDGEVGTATFTALGLL